MLRIRFIHPWRAFAVGHEDEYPLGVADLYVRMGLAVVVALPAGAGVVEPVASPPVKPAKPGGKRVRTHEPHATGG